MTNSIGPAQPCSAAPRPALGSCWVRHSVSTKHRVSCPRQLLGQSQQLLGQSQRQHKKPRVLPSAVAGLVTAVAGSVTAVAGSVTASAQNTACPALGSCWVSHSVSTKHRVSCPRQLLGQSQRQHKTRPVLTGQERQQRANGECPTKIRSRRALKVPPSITYENPSHKSTNESIS